MRLTLRQAAQQGIITAIVKDRYYRNDRIVEFANMIRDLDQECGSTCAADFRDRLGRRPKAGNSDSGIFLIALALRVVVEMIIYCATHYYFRKNKEMIN